MMCQTCSSKPAPSTMYRQEQREARFRQAHSCCAHPERNIWSERFRTGHPHVGGHFGLCRQEQEEAHPGRGTRRERFQFRTGRPRTGHPRTGAAAARTQAAAGHTRGARHSPAAARSLAAEDTAAWPHLQAPAPALTRLSRCAACSCTVSAGAKKLSGRSALACDFSASMKILTRGMWSSLPAHHATACLPRKVIFATHLIAGGGWT